jgi:hypothetical protein
MTRVALEKSEAISKVTAEQLDNAKRTLEEVSLKK